MVTIERDCAPIAILRHKPNHAMLNDCHVCQSGCASAQEVHFVRPLPFLGGAEDVIFDVCMSSPMYDCKNLFPPSSFSCSLFTSSTRSTIACKLARSSLACLINSSLAASPNRSTSALFRLGDIVRTSPSSISESTVVSV